MFSIKLANYRCVWNYIHNSKVVTIPQISKNTGLSLPTVTKAIDFSLGEGILCEAGLFGGERGRKAKAYSLNPDYAHFVLVYISDKKLSFEVHSFLSTVLKKGTVEIKNKNFLTPLDLLLEKLISEDGAVKMVGIAFPGNIRSGTIKASQDFNFAVGFNLKTHISDRFSLPCFVENVLNVAVSSRLFGMKERAKGISVAFRFGNGGCRVGIVIDGELLEGAGCCSGTLSNMSVRCKDSNEEERYAELLRSVCALLDPNEVMLYPDGSNAKRVVALAFEAFGEQDVPRLEERDFEKDVFIGFMVICRKELLNPEHPGSVLGLDIK